MPEAKNEVAAYDLNEKFASVYEWIRLQTDLMNPDACIIEHVRFRCHLAIGASAKMKAILNQDSQQEWFAELAWIFNMIRDHESPCTDILGCIEDAEILVALGNYGLALEAAVAAGTLFESWVGTDALQQRINHINERKTVPFAKKTAALNAAKTRSRVLAQSRWESDINQEIRIGVMADLVYRDLANEEEHSSSLPSTAEALKPWIRAVAPPYALRGGKPRNPSR